MTTSNHVNLRHSLLTVMSRPGVQPHTSTYGPAQSSRSLYPSFLPVQDTLLLQLSCAWRGLVDAFRWDVVVSTVARCVLVCLDCTLLILLQRPRNTFQRFQIVDIEYLVIDIHLYLRPTFAAISTGPAKMVPSQLWLALSDFVASSHRGGIILF